jgi:hypothetical protein
VLVSGQGVFYGPRSRTGDRARYGNLLDPSFNGFPERLGVVGGWQALSSGWEQLDEFLRHTPILNPEVGGVVACVMVPSWFG